MTNSTNSIKFSDVLKIASNKTDYLVVGFAGIPENILFNLAASLILLVIFFVLRKSISHDKTVIMSQARQESIEPLINTSKGSLETTV
ncbi:hypothetical protein A3Q56_05914 [Intoshia linei]|uniref:Uncharacterized protein n=1 Tax=Intoshia linei TaxID=1819745 RepID=A0A177AWH1_9BILA|nr:hypothetical protein A3Q56_05914 [Intoshia linei]